MLLISIIPNKNVILLSFCYIYHLCYHIPLYLKCNFYQIVGDAELIFGTPTPSRGRSGKICSFEKIILQGSPVVRSLTAFEFVPRDKCVLIIPLRLACWVTVPPTQLPFGSVQVLRQHFFLEGGRYCWHWEWRCVNAPLLSKPQLNYQMYYCQNPTHLKIVTSYKLFEISKCKL